MNSTDEIAEGLRKLALCGITTKQMTEVVKKIEEIIPPLSEADIFLINANPSLSRRDKKKLTKQIREYLKEGIKNDQ